MHHLPLHFWAAQIWFRYIRRCDAWRYRLAFDDVAHKGQEKYIFEGQLWAINEEHAVQLQGALNLHLQTHLQKQAYSHPQNNWMGLRYNSSSKRATWLLGMATGVRNVSNNMRKGWSPGGLKPGLFLNMVYQDLSQKLDHTIERVQQRKNKEQIIGTLALTLLLCLFLSLGSMVAIVIASLKQLALSWGVVYAAIFISVTFAMMSFGLMVRLREMLKQVGAKHE